MSLVIPNQADSNLPSGLITRVILLYAWSARHFAAGATYPLTPSTTTSCNPETSVQQLCSRPNSASSAAKHNTYSHPLPVGGHFGPLQNPSSAISAVPISFLYATTLILWTIQEIPSFCLPVCLQFHFNSLFYIFNFPLSHCTTFYLILAPGRSGKHATKLPGPNGISVGALKMCPESALLLRRTIRLPFKLSIFPNCWKQAVIFPIPKRGDSTDYPRNSLTPAFVKLLKTVISD